jgi:hypothetical protein
VIGKTAFRIAPWDNTFPATLRLYDFTAGIDDQRG